MQPELEIDQIERFWSKIDKRGDDECWLWKAGSKNKEGYGGFYLKQINNTVNAHKLMFLIVHNFSLDDIPDGIVIRHSCNNSKYVNPKHLKLGTHKDNSQDMVKAGNSLKVIKNPKYRNITKDEVNSIRSDFQNGKSARQISKERNISYFYIQELVKNRIHNDPSYVIPDVNHSVKFGDDVVKEIIDMKKRGYNIKEIKEKFKISQSQIYNYLRGDQRTNVGISS